MKAQLISVRFVDEALQCLRQRGLPVRSCLEAADLAEAKESVTAAQYGALWLAVAAAVDDEFLGLGKRPMHFGSFAMLTHAVSRAGTLEAALLRALRFLRLALDAPYGELVVENGLARIVLRDDGEPRSAFAYRTFWIIVHGLNCWLVRRRIPLLEVDFRGVPPSHDADYRTFFGASVRFDQPESCLAFDSTYLKLSAIRSQRSVKEFLRLAPANILIRFRHDAGVAAKVREQLQRQAPTAWPSFEALAWQMRLPASTLRRRLRLESQNYRLIKDAIRRNLATTWLLETERTIGDIATDLGFTEPSAFHRAFRKWTGETAGEFRRKNIGK